ncbi:hypothetical protein EG68_06544 [Paragonimus skrjabini miyazakii]|uniref:Uncharacterized protein n=1 Tax=Paragonimus skrjabini miyazakii TaxID=59628 RepID=A0A8S9Z0T5_9TREM|nr:hypothetical protein EG68_06544 [Paragonimus skrjabini miyazakii]
MINHIVLVILILVTTTQYGFAAISFAECTKKIAVANNGCISDALSMVTCPRKETPANTCRSCSACKSIKRRCLIRKLERPEFDKCPQAQTMIQSLWRLS